MNYFRFLFIGLLLVGYRCSAQPQVTVINDSLTITKLVTEYFVGSNIKVFNIRYRGEVDAIGLFTDAKAVTGMQAGIALSTGRVELIAGNNSRPNAGANFGRNYFTDEHLITKANMCDGAVLEFDFIPLYDSIYFNYFFGSDEYPEFVGKPFNDVFAFYIWPKLPNKIRPVNIGALPNGTTVMVNNVNDKNNAEWYIPNHLITMPYYEQIEFDGFTKPIKAGIRVIPGTPYHIKMIIADLEDCEYDSGILLEAHSFNAINTKWLKPTRKQLYVQFETGSAALTQLEEIKLKKIRDSIAQFAYDSIMIIGHTDSTGNEIANYSLSQARAETLAHFFAEVFPPTTTLYAMGKGSSQPLQPNQTEKGRAANRRVELILYRKLLP